MRILNQTDLTIAPLAGRINFPRHSLTWIVKGTFDLKPGGVAVPAAKSSFPTGDEFYPGDEERTGSPRYESDFAWLKPRADLLLVGSCRPPHGEPATRCPVVFRVGQKSRSLIVLGPRHWEKNWLTYKATEATPFTHLELRYENSFGGNGFPANPVGHGRDEVTDAAGGKTWPLPNIEDPATLILNHGQRPPPAGFGPLGRGWALRHGKLGTYKGSYRKTRWPWFPEDFDWGYLNAAPPEMQLEGYLRGDETVGFDNLHPQHPRYECQLPGLRPRCFVQRQAAGPPGPARFDEVKLQLDTLWVDAEAEQLVLVWRGWTEAASEEYEDIAAVYVVTEPLAQLPAAAEQHQQAFAAQLATPDQAFAAEAPPASPPPEKAADPAAAAAAAAAGNAAKQAEKAEMVRKLRDQAATINAQLGLAQLTPPLRQQALDLQGKIIDQVAESDQNKVADNDEASMRLQLAAALEKIGLDPNNLPSQVPGAQDQAAKILGEFGLGPSHVALDPSVPALDIILGAALVRMGANLGNLEPVLAEAQKLKEKHGFTPAPPPATAAPAPAKVAIPAVPSAAAPTAAPPPPAPTAAKPKWTRESIVAHHGKKGDFGGADLHGLDLSGLDLSGAEFSGADLTGARLGGANLRQTIFSQARLAGADLTGTDLTKANAAGADFSGAQLRKATLADSDLTRAKFAKADLSQAVLDGAVLEEADLRGAVLSEASARGTLFPRAQLDGANLAKIRAAKADFSKATMNQADAQGADFTEAAFGGAVGHNLNLSDATLTKVRAGGRCDFTGAKLVRVQGDGSVWKHANLTQADLRHAQMEDAIFTAACLRESDLSASTMKFGRFNKTDLRGAKLIRMNLFQGSLEKANLTQTDLSGSNLYEVELRNAVLDRTVADGANVKLTLLDRL